MTLSSGPSETGKALSPNITSYVLQLLYRSYPPSGERPSSNSYLLERLSPCAITPPRVKLLGVHRRRGKAALRELCRVRAEGVARGPREFNQPVRLVFPGGAGQPDGIQQQAPRLTQESFEKITAPLSQHLGVWRRPRISHHHR